MITMACRKIRTIGMYLKIARTWRTYLWGRTGHIRYYRHNYLYHQAFSAESAARYVLSSLGAEPVSNRKISRAAFYYVNEAIGAAESIMSSLSALPRLY